MTDPQAMQTGLLALVLAVVLLSWRLNASTRELHRRRAALEDMTAKLAELTGIVLTAAERIINAGPPGSMAVARAVELRRELEELRGRFFPPWKPSSIAADRGVKRAGE